MNDFLQAMAHLRPSSTFLTILGYRNEHSEVANYSIVFHMDYASALRKSIDIIEKQILTESIELQAKKELIDSFNASLSKMETTTIDEMEDGYIRFKDENGLPIKGVKMHPETKELHLFGLIAHKKVLIPTVYPKKNKRELTKAKDHLRYLTPMSKFRQFRLTPNNVDSITVEKLSLLPPQ
jgi:hypothetical protein